MSFFIFSEKSEQTAVLLKQLMRGEDSPIVRNNIGANAKKDFWLMRQCRHFIIGNSTFAWWAAWLAEQDRSGTQVFAPSRNLNPEHSVTAWGFPGLLPERWTVL